MDAGLVNMKSKEQEGRRRRRGEEQGGKEEKGRGKAGGKWAEDRT